MLPLHLTRNFSLKAFISISKQISLSGNFLEFIRNFTPLALKSHVSPVACSSLTGSSTFTRSSARMFFIFLMGSLLRFFIPKSAGKLEEGAELQKEMKVLIFIGGLAGSLR